MISANLIPMRRRQQRRLRARSKGWAIAAVFYAVLLGGGYASWRGAWARDDRDPARHLADVQSHIQDTTKEINQLRAALNEARMSLQLDRSIGSQPDWGMLLALLGKLRGEDLVLNHCGLEINVDKTTEKAADNLQEPPAPDAPAHIILRLAGYGRSQAAVAQFVLRLEQTALFDDVSLVKTNREPFLESQAMSFKIECLLKIAAEPKPGESTPGETKPEPRRGNFAGTDAAGSAP